MNSILAIIIAFSCMFAGHAVWADEPPPIVIPIDIENPPVKKPRTPGLLKLSACLVGDEVVVTSNIDVMAEIKIYDAEIDQTYYNATVALAPECRCPLPQVDAELILQIIIDDRKYQGTFQR